MIQYISILSQYFASIFLIKNYVISSIVCPGNAHVEIFATKMPYFMTTMGYKVFISSFSGLSSTGTGGATWSVVYHTGCHLLLSEQIAIATVSNLKFNDSYVKLLLQVSVMKSPGVTGPPSCHRSII